MSKFNPVIVIFFTFLLLIDCKRSIILVHRRPELKYNGEYVNLSWDLSVFEHSTREHPVTIVPEINAVLRKDITRVSSIVSFIDIRSQNTDFYRKADACVQLKKITPVNIFIKPIIESIVKNSKFKLECPFKKGTVITIQPFDMGAFQVPSIVPNNIEKSFTLIIMAGKRALPIFSVTFYVKKVEIDN